MIAQTINRNRIIANAILHFIALAFILFVPALSHMLGVPLYYMEPMRFFIILAMAHSTKANAYLLALTLPLFSFLVAGHPGALKMVLISAELLFNVWLFYALLARTGKFAVSAIASIVLSKVGYYAIKLSLISLALFSGSAIGIPLWAQAISTAIFGVYLSIVFSKKSS